MRPHRRARPRASRPARARVHDPHVRQRLRKRSHVLCERWWHLPRARRLRRPDHRLLLRHKSVRRPESESGIDDAIRQLLAGSNRREHATRRRPGQWFPRDESGHDELGLGQCAGWGRRIQRDRSHLAREFLRVQSRRSSRRPRHSTLLQRRELLRQWICVRGHQQHGRRRRRRFLFSLHSRSAIVFIAAGRHMPRVAWLAHGRFVHRAESQLRHAGLRNMLRERSEPGARSRRRWPNR